MIELGWSIGDIEFLEQAEQSNKQEKLRRRQGHNKPVEIQDIIDKIPAEERKQQQNGSEKKHRWEGRVAEVGLEVRVEHAFITVAPFL